MLSRRFIDSRNRQAMGGPVGLRLADKPMPRDARGKFKYSLTLSKTSPGFDVSAV